MIVKIVIAALITATELSLAYGIYRIIRRFRK